MSDFGCETCSQDARWVFVSLDTVVAAACDKHRQPVNLRLTQLALEPAAKGQSGADLAELSIENYVYGMKMATYHDSPDDPRDVP
jgi:hypothetical protein